jgi:hypothetical protein
MGLDYNSTTKAQRFTKNRELKTLVDVVGLLTDTNFILHPSAVILALERA